MAALRQTLVDDTARRLAITVHDRSLLVEAGAGSGKTAVLAGRIAMLLAEGVAPRSIAAVTFTEFAASELLMRVREFVGALANGDVPPQLRVALPEGLSEAQCRRLAAASDTLDELTCSTIHGFCLCLIKPYPVEADLDPGAAVMDRDQADLAFQEITDAWLREELTGETDGLLPELVLRNPDGTVVLIRTVLDHLRHHRAIAHEAPEDLAPLATAFRESTNAFIAFMSDVDTEEPESAAIANRFRELGEAVVAYLPVQTPAHIVSLLLTAPHQDLSTQAGTLRKYQKKGKWRAAAKRAGLSQAEGERLNDLAGAHYARCCETWSTVQQAVASHVLAALIPLVRPVMDRFRDYKRSAALIDFDDLIFAARDLLRDHDDVRQGPWPRALPASSWMSFRTPIPCRPRYSGASVETRQPSATVPTGRASRSDPEPSFLWAIPSRRSIAFAVRTSLLMFAPARHFAPRPRRQTACSRSRPIFVHARQLWTT